MQGSTQKNFSGIAHFVQPSMQSKTARNARKVDQRKKRVSPRPRPQVQNAATQDTPPSEHVHQHSTCLLKLFPHRGFCGQVTLHDALTSRHRPPFLGAFQMQNARASSAAFARQRRSPRVIGHGRVADHASHLHVPAPHTLARSNATRASARGRNSANEMEGLQTSNRHVYSPEIPAAFDPADTSLRKLVNGS